MAAENTCPKCHQETTQASAYCRYCGFLLGEAVPVRDMPALSALLVYFALVVGLLALWFWLFPPAPAPVREQPRPIAGPRG